MSPRCPLAPPAAAAVPQLDPRWRWRIRFGLTLATVVLATACRAQPSRVDGSVLLANAAQVEMRAELRAEAELLARIRAEIGEARCASDLSCRTLPIGAKACGGPTAWLAWSIDSGRADPIQAWAQELAALQRRRNERRGMASDCRYLADPGAVCRAQRCVPGAPGVAGAR